MMADALSSLDIYDYLALVALIVLAIAFFSVAMFVLGLPGKIAHRRNHPHAEAVNLMGWVGFLAVIPWIHALIWAYHDGTTVDIRSVAPKAGAAPPEPPEPPASPSEMPRPQTRPKQPDA